MDLESIQFLSGCAEPLTSHSQQIQLRLESFQLVVVLMQGFNHLVVLMQGFNYLVVFMQGFNHLMVFMQGSIHHLVLVLLGPLVQSRLMITLVSANCFSKVEECLCVYDELAIFDYIVLNSHLESTSSFSFEIP